MTGRRTSPLHGLWFVPFLIVGLGTTARVDEAPKDVLEERVERLEERIEDHRREDAARKLDADLELAVDLFHKAADLDDGEEIQESLVREVGALTRKREEHVRLAALDALGEMGHEKGARYLKRYLKPYRDAKRQKRSRAAIAAAGKVADDSLVRPLLKIVDRSKNHGLAAKAMLALGQFGDCERYREHILEELVDTLKSDMPAAPKPGRDAGDTYLPARNGHGGTSRWSTLSRVLPRALNELTGRNMRSVGDWMAMVDEYERDLDVLFVDDDEE